MKKGFVSPLILTAVVLMIVLTTIFGLWLRNKIFCLDCIGGPPEAKIMPVVSPSASTDEIVKSTKIISQSKTSPDRSFSVTEETFGDHQVITVKDAQGNSIVDDLVVKNEKEIGYNVKFGCQCGASFQGWVDDSRFAIKIVNGAGEEYEYLVDAKSGKVDESTFKRIK